MRFVPDYTKASLRVLLAAGRIILLSTATQLSVARSHAALPECLVILLDGVAYNDLKSLQEGTLSEQQRRTAGTTTAFTDGYFPVSRLVSTFPSASDVAWTDILGNTPLPGYQRTYLSAATGRLVRQNGVTTSMEYELQMHWQLEDGFQRAMGYVRPHASFKRETHELTEALLNATNGPSTFYAMIRSSDDAQHTSGNIFKLLGILDAELQQLRARYHESEGRELRIVILSDHGNNHSGAGKRVRIQSFLRKAGFHITDRLANPNDVVLPTVGIQNWVEVNCQPGQVESLARELTLLEGVDIITCRLPDQPNRFLVFNSKGEEAAIDWRPYRDDYRYQVLQGDPLGYVTVMAALKKEGSLDEDGFASAESWMEATLTNHYPVALERIARGHSVITVNPAPILIALQDGYVHSGWLLKQMSSLMKMGGTHGGLNAPCSNGILLSNFKPTQDTTTRHVAGQFGGFNGLRDPRSGRNGAEWFYPDTPLVASAGQDSLSYISLLPVGSPLLCVWTPAFEATQTSTMLEVTLQKEPRYKSARVRRTDPDPLARSRRQAVFTHPLQTPRLETYERLYDLPAEWKLGSAETYRIQGRMRGGGKKARVFDFTFMTDADGRPVVD